MSAAPLPEVLRIVEILPRQQIHITTESDMNTHHIAPNSPSNKNRVETPKLDRAAFAAGIARHEFGGRNYRGADHDGFEDHSPAAIAIMRAMRWSGAAR